MKKLLFLLNCKKMAAITCLGISALAIADPMEIDAHHAGCKHQEHMQDKAFMPPLGFMPPPSMPRFLNGIKLTDEQNDKIFALTYPEIPKKHDRMKQRMQLIRTMQTLSSNDKLDENQVKIVAEKLATIEKEELISKVMIENKIFQTLTAEQRTQLLQNQTQESDSRMMMPMHFTPMHSTKDQPHHQNTF